MIGKILSGIALAAVIMFVALVPGCTIVNAGYVGVKVNNYGEDRGVAAIPVVTGRVVYNRFTTNVYEFPTFIQNRVWEGENAISFNSVEGAQFTVDLGTGIAFKPDMVPHIFAEQRKDPDHIIDLYVRNQIRDAFSGIASKMKMSDIYGAGKTTLVNNVRVRLDSTLGRKGYVIDNVSIIGKIRMDPQVEKSINSALAASQKAVEAENKVAESRALAEQAIATARGDSAAAVIRASGQAAANSKLQQSITPQLIQYESAKRWNGVLPSMMGGSAMPFVNIPKPPV
jgi:regulator of protease activity HflC (stomatin/prohibitin superfamily)